MDEVAAGGKADFERDRESAGRVDCGCRFGGRVVVDCFRWCIVVCFLRLVLVELEFHYSTRTLIAAVVAVAAEERSGVVVD